MPTGDRTCAEVHLTCVFGVMSEPEVITEGAFLLKIMNDDTYDHTRTNACVLAFLESRFASGLHKRGKVIRNLRATFDQVFKSNYVAEST